MAIHFCVLCFEVLVMCGWGGGSETKGACCFCEELEFGTQLSHQAALKYLELHCEGLDDLF